MKGNTQLRQNNIKRLFSIIRSNGPISKRELQELTGFSWGNISSITTELEQSGYIMSVGKQKSFVGRRPEEYDVNISDNLILGVDFNHVGFLAVLTDMRGRVITSHRVTFEEETVDTALEKLFGCIENILSEYAASSVRYISFAMQGAVSAERISAAGIKGIKGWKNIPLAQLTEDRFGIKTVLIHDPDCIIRTEMHFGALTSPEINNAFLVRVDHGVGMSIMTERRLYTGSEGRSGEIGYTLVSSGGNYSSLDSFVTEPSLIHNYKSLAGEKSGTTIGNIAELARKGDASALRVFDEAGRALGAALSNAVNLLYPEIIILFGSFSQYHDLYLETVNGMLKKYVYDADVEVKISELSDDAAAVGAALFASERVIEETDFVL